MKLRPEVAGICQLLLTQGRELFESQGFVKTVNEEKSLNEMKSKNSVFAYWQHVVFHNKKEHKEAIHKIYMDNLAVFEVPNAMQEATAIHSKKEMERIYNHVNKDLRNIESMRYYDLILQYNTGAEGIIWIVNIDEHYELYKKHFENDEVHKVSKNNFKASTGHFMIEHYGDRFKVSEPYQIWQTDSSGVHTLKYVLRMIE